MCLPLPYEYLAMEWSSGQDLVSFRILLLSCPPCAPSCWLSTGPRQVQSRKCREVWHDATLQSLALLRPLPSLHLFFFFFFSLWEKDLTFWFPQCFDCITIHSGWKGLASVLFEGYFQNKRRFHFYSNLCTRASDKHALHPQQPWIT